MPYLIIFKPDIFMCFNEKYFFAYLFTKHGQNKGTLIIFPDKIWQNGFSFIYLSTAFEGVLVWSLLELNIGSGFLVRNLEQICYVKINRKYCYDYLSNLIGNLCDLVRHNRDLVRHLWQLLVECDFDWKLVAHLNIKWLYNYNK